MQIYVLNKYLEFLQYEIQGIFTTNKKAREAAEQNLLTCVKKRGKWENNTLIYKFEEPSWPPLEYFIKKYEIKDNKGQCYLLSAKYEEYPDETIGIYSTIKEAQERAKENLEQIEEDGKIEWEGETKLRYYNSYEELKCEYNIKEFKIL